MSVSGSMRGGSALPHLPFKQYSVKRPIPHPYQNDDPSDATTRSQSVSVLPYLPFERYSLRSLDGHSPGRHMAHPHTYPQQNDNPSDATTCYHMDAPPGESYQRVLSAREPVEQDHSQGMYSHI